MIDPRLKHVVAAAKCGSFTAAAQSIGVSQSAVTKSIGELERQIGYPIFHRTARGVMLTEQGRDFVERATRLLDDARDLLREPGSQADPYAGILRIGVCPASLEWQLVDPVTALITRHPSIRFDISGASFERMAQQLRGGAVDVAVGFEHAFSDHADFERQPLAPLNTTIFVRKDHPLLDVASPTAADVAQYEYVTPSDSRPYGARIRELYERHGVDSRTMIHVVDYFPVVKRIVANSNAVGVVAVQYTQTAAFKKRFAAVDVVNRLPLAPLCCAVRANWEPGPAVRAFITACRVSFSPESPAGSPGLAAPAMSASHVRRGE
jgi:DNA-binding transcriptional LysR family regulator